MEAGVLIMGKIQEAAATIEEALGRLDASIDRTNALAADVEVISRHMSALAVQVAELSRASTALHDSVAALAETIAELQSPIVEPPVEPPVEHPVEPPVAPPVETTEGYDAYKLFNDRSVTWKEFNEVGGLYWRREGGDWKDKNGTEWGDVPFGSIELTTKDVGPLSLEVTELVREWLADINDGVMLLSSEMGERATSILLRPREHDIPEERPEVVVFAGDQAYRCPCVSDTYLSPTSITPLGERDRVAVLRGMMRFDLTGVPEQFDRAELRVTAWRVYRDHTLKAFRVWPPVPFDAAPIRHFGSGADHSDVIVTFDWSGDWKNHPRAAQGERSVRYAFEPEQVIGPDGDTWLKIRMPTDPTATKQGEGTGFSTIVQIGDVPSSISSDKRDPFGPTALYARYSLMLGDDWTAVDDPQMTGGKFPGLIGQYGMIRRYAGIDYWQRTIDGGTPGLGVFAPDGQYRTGDSFMGWSGRSGWHAKNAYGRHEDPMHKCTPMGNYLYYPEHTAAGTGEDTPWKNAFLETGRPYQLEQFVQMNDVDMSNADVYGNGQGLPNGILRWWIDGVIVFERTDVIWRHHPAIAVDQWWGTIKNGGTISPVQEHTIYLGRVVVSKSYIGPTL